MTLPLRRKHPTTARATSWLIRRAASLLGLGLLWAGAPAFAQHFAGDPAEPPAGVLTFSKPAAAPVVVPEPPAQPAPSAQPAQPPAAAPVAAADKTAAVRPVAMVQPPAGPADAQQDTETVETLTKLTPPNRDELFRLDTERDLFERIRQFNKKTQTTTTFPDEVPLSKEPFVPRSFPARAELVEPNYLCYSKLLFEDLNSERYGWDLGWVQPFVSGGLFFFDLATLPYHAFTRPCEKECNAGYCLPGDPVPYLIYPPECSWTGAVAEVGAVVALVAIFP